MYEEFCYSGGVLQFVDTCTDYGADGRWFTADDVLGSYFSQQSLVDGWQRIYYGAAGVDGLWKNPG